MKETFQRGNTSTRIKDILFDSNSEFVLVNSDNKSIHIFSLTNEYEVYTSSKPFYSWLQSKAALLKQTKLSTLKLYKSKVTPDDTLMLINERVILVGSSLDYYESKDTLKALVDRLVAEDCVFEMNIAYNDNLN